VSTKTSAKITVSRTLSPTKSRVLVILP
jgi:hypothetical protein